MYVDTDQFNTYASIQITKVYTGVQYMKVGNDVWSLDLSSCHTKALIQGVSDNTHVAKTEKCPGQNLIHIRAQDFLTGSPSRTFRDLQL